jgi:steroid 5-alpha reductase family enzyme
MSKQSGPHAEMAERVRIKRGLIADGMYRFIRHPNYLGEMLTYGSFALIVWALVAFPCDSLDLGRVICD